MGQVLDHGTLAAASASLLGAAPNKERYVSLMCRNGDDDVQLVTVSINDTVIAAVTLAVGDTLAINGLALAPDDTVEGFADDVDVVSYVAFLSHQQPLVIETIDSAGARKTSAQLPPQSMGTIRPPLFDGRNGDYTVLDATGSATALKLDGTVGTETFLATGDVQDGTNTCLALFEFVLPQSYATGTNLNIIANVLRVVASGTTLTTSIDMSAWIIDDEGLEADDLVTTSVQAFTNTTAADVTFVVDGTDLTPGARLLLRLTVVATEAGDAGTVTARLNSLSISEAA